MSLETAIAFAKNSSDEKVPFRFQFPIQTKKEFEVLCEKHDVTMTDMLLGLIQSAIDEDKGLTNVSVLNIINKIEELEKSYDNLADIYNKTEQDVLECDNGQVIYVTDDMEKLRFRINVLNKELERRS